MALGASWASVAPLRAQFDANLGRIVGTISDRNGGAIIDAEVVATNLDTGVRRAGYGEASGFHIGSLRPGRYTVTASSPDFADATAEGVVVAVGSTVRVDLTMDVESTYEQVVVTAALLDAIMPAASNVVRSDTFNDLPINGRRFHDFALLTPTVQVSPESGQLSFAAQRGIYTNVVVDGTNYNQAFFGGIQGGERSGAAMTLPQSAIQEFQAITTGFTAEYGRTTSGVVNVSTKSGGNELHGDAFYQIRHPDLGRPDPFGEKVLERLTQLGGSIGGPVVPDRSFFFFAWESQFSNSPRYVEFPLLDAADRESGPEAYDYFRSLEEPFDATNDAIAMTPRWDYAFANGSQLMVRYNYSRSEGRNAVGIGGPTLPRTTSSVGTNGTELNSIHYLTGQLTSVLSAATVNQLRVTVTREERPRLPNLEAPLVASTMGSFGTRSYLPTTETDKRPVISDSLILHSGSHDLKFGGMLDRIWVDDVFGYNQFGTFRLFSSDPDEILDILTPGGAIANRFDAPGLYFRQIGNTLGDQRLGHAALFVQDSWQAAPGLTLDLGLRWEGQFNQSPRVGNDDLIARVSGAAFPAGSVDPTYLPDSTRQWMPRIGFAYSPAGSAGRLVVRGSAGLFYATTPPVWFNAATKAFRSPPFNVSVSVPGATGTIYTEFLKAGIDLNQYALGQMPAFSVEDVTRILEGDAFAGASPTVVHPDFRNPRSVKYSLATEFGITERIVGGLQWLRQNTSLLHGLRDYNLPPSAVRPDDPAQIPFYDLAARPAPTLAAVPVVESIGRADYNGITASWKYLGDSLQVVAHYTYSRANSSDSNEAYLWAPTYHDNMRPDLAHGPSALDMRHQFTGHAVAKLFAGITWSAILRTSSAHPLSPQAGMDLNGDNYFGDRPLQAPGVPMGRNSFRNRGVRNLDMRFLRSFNIADSKRLEISFELFNAFNFENVLFGGFNSIYGTGVDLATGQPMAPLASFRRLRSEDGSYDRNNIQGGGGPFQLQVGARFFF